MKHRGNINVSFLDPIMPGKTKENFLKELEEKIYSEMKKNN